jgi:hypothetical protein
MAGTKFLAGKRESGSSTVVVKDVGPRPRGECLALAGRAIVKGARVESSLCRGLWLAAGNGGHAQEEIRSARSHRASRLFPDPLPIRQPEQLWFRI